MSSIGIFLLSTAADILEHHSDIFSTFAFFGHRRALAGHAQKTVILRALLEQDFGFALRFGNVYDGTKYRVKALEELRTDLLVFVVVSRAFRSRGEESQVCVRSR